MKKVIWISGFAIIFLILSIVTGIYTLGQAKDSIEQIGPVSLSETSYDEISDASKKYFDLSASIGSSILFSESVDNYVDYEKLALAQEEYLGLAIGDILETEDSEENEDLIEEKLIAVRETLTAFYPDEDYSPVEQYEEFVQLEEEFGLSTSES